MKQAFFNSIQEYESDYSLPGGFEQFWKAYPRKIAKGEARRVWFRLKPDSALLERILKAIEAQKRTEQWHKESGKFIPHPATWLNGERWEDETKIQLPRKEIVYQCYDCGVHIPESKAKQHPSMPSQRLCVRCSAK